MKEYNIFVLPNGLRCVHLRTQSHVSYIGMAVNAGSRDESSSKHGLAHFVEHTIFKGTEHRSSWHISNRMESIGGELNAYTSKEETLIYTNSPAGHSQRAMELISDILAYSSFPAAELDKERDVVIEEIYSYRDSPSDSVYDMFDDMIYAGSGPGHNILGTPESVKELVGKDCHDFIEDFYVPSNMVLYAATPDDCKTIERLALKYFGHFHLHGAVHKRAIPPMNPTFNETISRDGHQAHTIMGARTFGRSDDRRFALFLLNNYLGGPCMNSRLNQELRERRGYVYTVDSSVALLSDAGTMMIYFGSDKSTVEKCVKIIQKELHKLVESSMKSGIFEKIKRQYAGQLLVSSDHRESMAMSMGKSLMYYGEVHDVEWTTERIMAVQAEDVRSVAELLVPRLVSKLTLC
ncbi:MAG: insulinase family protein [Prevotella sp.]|nr:insulinase family protein [Bacteroides sp.]MCM1366978.1 insulinase family protein [Prevotella sp.]MCM1437487.1 insulinase family protein [Prevotella sp.]